MDIFGRIIGGQPHGGPCIGGWRRFRALALGGAGSRWKGFGDQPVDNGGRGFEKLPNGF